MISYLYLVIALILILVPIKQIIINDPNTPSISNSPTAIDIPPIIPEYEATYSSILSTQFPFGGPLKLKMNFLKIMVDYIEWRNLP